MSTKIVRSSTSSLTISQIEIQNFKSISNITVDLGKMNIIVGRNASGKSNFIDVFRFLKDIAEKGLRQSILIHGGTIGIHNINSQERVTKISITGQAGTEISLKDEEMSIGDFYYSIQFSTTKSLSTIKIKSEILRVKIVLRDRIDDFVMKRVGTGRITVKTKVKTFHSPIQYLPIDTALLQFPINLVVFWIRESVMQSFRLFDLYSKTMKEIVPNEKTLFLSEDGSNLPSVISAMPEKTKKRFLHNVRYILDFVEDISTQTILGSSHILQVQEKFNSKYMLPASSLSEGTINIIALIVAIKHQPGNVILIEEPERFVHPSLLHRLMKLISEECEKRQIIITTHSPELVENSPIESVILIDRKSDGTTIIRKPKDSDIIRRFIDDGLTLGDLMKDNSL